MKITFIRHGETEHNRERIWQGLAEGQLSEEGRRQARAAAVRLGSYDLILSSDLDRTMQTVEELGVEAIPDPTWREVDVGTWAGKTFQQTLEEDGDTLAAMRAGEDVALGGGETLSQLSERVQAGIADIFGRLGDDGHALVVTHGGVIMSVVADLWQLPTVRNGTVAPTNTSFTTIERRFGHTRLARFNDAAHLGHAPGPIRDAVEAGERVVTFIRHGETDANVQEVWQGQQDWGLNELGRRQASQLAEHFADGFAHVVSSPLGRARQTAALLNGADPRLDERLMEIDMGRWEGLTHQEVTERYGDLLDRMFKAGEDVRRGGDGENWEDLTARVGAAFDSIVTSHTDDSLALVGHGSSLRALVLRAIGGGWERARRTGILPNTGYARLVSRGDRWWIADYGLAPHLE